MVNAGVGSQVFRILFTGWDPGLLAQVFLRDKYKQIWNNLERGIFTGF
jgi:hypothetical protein